MQIYLHLTGLTRAMYLAVCKDTDELHVERIEHDPLVAQGLLDKAQRVIQASLPPDRISNDPAWYLCRWCEHAQVCHGQTAAEINCRTCLHSAPVEGGWHCTAHQRPISDSEQRTACAQHLYLPALVPGEQVDAGEGWVEYLFGEGLRWRDTGFDKVSHGEGTAC